MSLYETRHADGTVTNFEWPAAVRTDPDYPELEPMSIDLAGDTLAAAPSAPKLRLVQG